MAYISDVLSTVFMYSTKIHLLRVDDSSIGERFFVKMLGFGSYACSR